MKKKIVVLMVIFVVTFGIARLWSNTRNTVSGSNAPRKPIIECSATKVRQISFERTGATPGDEKISLQRVDIAASGLADAIAALDAKWNTTSPEASEANADLSMRLADALCGFFEVVEEKNIEMGNVNLKIEFSEGEAAATGAGKKWTLSFSEKTVRGRVYLSVLGSSQIYSVPEKIAALFRMPFANYKNRRVMGNRLDNLQLARIKFSNKERFTLERAGADWQISFAKQKNLPTTDEATKFVNRLGTLMAMETFKNEISTEECAKLAPDVTVELEAVAGRKETIHFSKPKQSAFSTEKRMIACSSEHRALFGVHPDLWSFLDVQPKALMGK